MNYKSFTRHNFFETRINRWYDFAILVNQENNQLGLVALSQTRSRLRSLRPLLHRGRCFGLTSSSLLFSN
jgi:hypothetical protein